MYSEKALEQKLRRELNKVGYALHKSRKSLSADNLGGYMVVDISHNAVVAGPRYELDLDDIQELLEA